jgi:transposase
MLAIPGAWVESVTFAPEGVVVGLRRRSRRLRCPCGLTTRARYDTSRRRWRHLDVAACRLFLEADIARIDCPRCGRVRTEEVPWARPRARHTRDFEDVVAWLAQRSDLSTVSTLLRCAWKTVHDIIARVVVDHIDEARLEGLYRIGVDEISYKRHHNYLTIVADHDTGRVVWIAKGKRGAALEAFYEALGAEGRTQIEAVSMDLTTIYRDATRRCVPHAVICFDPFHVVRLANRALDSVYKSFGRQHRTGIGDRDWRRTRVVLRSGAENLDATQLEILDQLRHDRYELWRAWELKEALRDLYRIVAPDTARAYLRHWVGLAAASTIPAFEILARSIDRNLDGIAAAVEHNLANSRLEGINAKIRLISRRGYGHHSTRSLAALIYLCLGGITITLPTKT